MRSHFIPMILPCKVSYKVRNYEDENGWGLRKVQYRRCDMMQVCALIDSVIIFCYTWEHEPRK